MVFEGTYTALVTPFRDGTLDLDRFKRQLDHQRDGNVRGWVVNGTTGESPTLTEKERDALLETALAHGLNRAQVVAGTGSNDTKKTVEMTLRAKALGAHGALLVVPYYNKPTQEGLYRHFKAVAETVDLPLMLYNVPGRSGTAMTPETIARLSEVRGITAVKEAGGNADQVSAILALCRITVLSGDDALTLPMIAVGARGVVSVASNVVPGPVAELCGAALSGKLDHARSVHYRLYPLFRALFVESNPIPVKMALEMMGLDSGELRMPLCTGTEATRAGLKKVLGELGLAARAS